MKKAAYYILLFLPTTALVLYYISQCFFMKSIWSEFFQTRTAFDSTFTMVMFFGLLFACWSGTFLLKLGQLLFIILKKRWKTLKILSIETTLIFLLPLVTLFLVDHLSDGNVILKSLTVSLEKEDFDTQILLAWLDILDAQQIEQGTRLLYQKDDLPQEVKDELFALKPDSVWLEVAKDNRPYVNLRFSSMFMDLGVIIGAGSQTLTFPPEEYEEYIDVFDVTERVCIWLE